MLSSGRYPIMLAVLLSLLLLYLPGCQEAASDTPVDPEQQPELSGDPEPSESLEEPQVTPEPEAILMPRIGLYSGKGSWDINVLTLERFLDQYGFEWSEFDDLDAVNRDLGADFDLIWFPGGFAAEYKNIIVDHANISSFVAEGGSFVGSCAGAYYASDILRWLGTDHQYPLKLFPGKGIGPLSGLINWGEIASFELNPDHPANEHFDGNLDFYYFDGPYFEPYAEETIEVLARYAVNNEPAIIAGRFGTGKYLLLGPHPELGGYSSDSSDFNLDGEEGAKWPWLYSALTWFAAW